MNLILKLKIGCAALSVLRKELSTREIIKILPAIIKMKVGKKPFKDFPLPQSKKDKESRKLIADAILLYRALLKKYPQADAERIMRSVICHAAVAQLKYLIPVIDEKTLNSLNQDEKRQMFCDIIAKFPNADYEIIKAEGKEYHYDITRCRLVELIELSGHPELKDAFCAGDGLYFCCHQPQIAFDCQSKIGDGAKTCQFRFTLKM